MSPLGQTSFRPRVIHRCHSEGRVGGKVSRFVFGVRAPGIRQNETGPRRSKLLLRLPNCFTSYVRSHTGLMGGESLPLVRQAVSRGVLLCWSRHFHPDQLVAGLTFGLREALRGLRLLQLQINTLQVNLRDLWLRRSINFSELFNSTLNRIIDGGRARARTRARPRRAPDIFVNCGPHTVVLHDGAACLLHATLLVASLLPTLAKQILGRLVEDDSLVLLRWSEALSVGGG